MKDEIQSEKPDPQIDQVTIYNADVRSAAVFYLAIAALFAIVSGYVYQWAESSTQEDLENRRSEVKELKQKYYRLTDMYMRREGRCHEWDLHNSPALNPTSGAYSP